MTSTEDGMKTQMSGEQTESKSSNTEAVGPVSADVCSNTLDSGPCFGYFRKYGYNRVS
jgi:hypothetical protein